MRHALLILLLLAGYGAAGPRAGAFSLVGALPAWFTDNAGLIPPADVYGPVNLGEEYRWPVPTINYAFDESFVNYFGQDGINEVEKAIKILNDLPAMSQVDLSSYPTHSQRVNYRARDLGMLDLKSTALKYLLEQLGLGTPGRFVFTLRGRDPQSDPPITNYLVIMRNFDPETWTPTPYINGQLWTYNDIYDNQSSPTVKATTVTEPVDPLILAEAVASMVSGQSYSVYGQGSYITGLTRDDVGGLRYLYRLENRNTETLPADAVLGTGGSSVGGGNGSWVPLPPVDTNTTSTGTGTGGTTPTPTPTTRPFYSQAIRGGADKITFTRGPSVYQPGGFTVTNQYQETIIALVTNGVQRSVTQSVRRVLTAPDILFSAIDLADTDTSNGTTDRNGIAVSNDAINGNVAADGPGQFTGAAIISFNKVGPVFLNTAPSFLSQPGSFSDFLWGSFDGTTNDPIVYPTGTSIKAWESQVFQGR